MKLWFAFQRRRERGGRLKNARHETEAKRCFAMVRGALYFLGAGIIFITIILHSNEKGVSESLFYDLVNALIMIGLGLSTVFLEKVYFHVSMAGKSQGNKGV